MNLEEELNILNTESTVTNTMNSVNENQVNSQFDMNNQVNNIPMNNNQMNPAYTMPAEPMGNMPAVNQPAMVNTNQAQVQADEMNFANLDFDINKPLYETNPVQRLTGEKGQTFRLHLLPGVSPQKVEVHWDGEKGHNIVCMKNVYNTQFEECCNTHGQAKSRCIIPVVVYQQVGNQVMPNSQAELKFLVLSSGQFNELQNQAVLSGTKLETADIFATVDNPKYKSFNFAVNSNSMIQNVGNLKQLTEECRRVMTPKNVCGAAGKVISREEYKAGYANYDKSKYEANNNTPTQAPPMGPTGYPYGQPQAFNQGNFYYDPSQSPYGGNTGGNFNQGFNGGNWN